MPTRKQRKPASPIDALNGQLMVMAAHRYCLGRSSYIATACIEWLCEWWPQVEEHTRNVIIRDTVQYLICDNGVQIYRREWEAFAVWAWKQMDEKGKVWLVQALAHLPKAWYPGRAK